MSKALRVNLMLKVEGGENRVPNDDRPSVLFGSQRRPGDVVQPRRDGSENDRHEARKLPDGIVVDVEAGHIYWTNMGSARRERRVDHARGSRRRQSHDHRS